MQSGEFVPVFSFKEMIIFDHRSLIMRYGEFVPVFWFSNNVIVSFIIAFLPTITINVYLFLKNYVCEPS